MSKLREQIHLSLKASLESQPEVVWNEDVFPSLEAASFELGEETGALEELVTKAYQTEKLYDRVLSLEGIDDVGIRRAYNQSRALLEGVDVDVEKLLPSLEADADAKSTIEKLKEFLLKMWAVIKSVTAKIWDGLQKMFKQLTAAERMLIVEAQRLRGEALKHRDAISKLAKVPYTAPMGWVSTREVLPTDHRQLLERIREYQAVHSVFHRGFGGMLKETLDDVYLATSKIQNVQSANEALKSARKGMRRMDPDKVAKLFGSQAVKEASRNVVFLTHDRYLAIYGAFTDKGPVFEEQLRSIHFKIEQLPIQLKADQSMEAMSERDIEQVLDATLRLLEYGTRVDSFERFMPIVSKNEMFQDKLKYLIEHMSADMKVQLQEILRYSQTLAQWTAAPFGKFDTVTVMFARSVLTICRAHLANFTTENDVGPVVVAEKEDKSKKDKKDKKPDEEKKED